MDGREDEAAQLRIVCDVAEDPALLRISVYLRVDLAVRRGGDGEPLVV